jgi:hypothetical protein
VIVCIRFSFKQVSCNLSTHTLVSRARALLWWSMSSILIKALSKYINAFFKNLTSDQLNMQVVVGCRELGAI